MMEEEATSATTKAVRTAGNLPGYPGIRQGGSGMRSAVETLLVRLDGVKSTAAGRWLAHCPAHEDRSPSLAIREIDDGTVLVKCFAGCGAAAVVAAVHLELADLFPRGRGDEHRRRPIRRSERHVPRDVLSALADEILVVLLAAEDAAAGRAVSDPDRQRLATAEARIRSAAREVGCNV